MTKLPRNAKLLTTVAAFLLCGNVGCRAISRYHEKQQSIAARGLSRQGLKAMHEGDWDTAETMFGDALDISSGDDDAHRGIAEALWNRDEYVDAISHMEQAVRVSANDPKHVQRLGEMYLHVGRVDEAIDQGTIALQAERQSPEAWVLRGDCLYAKSDYGKALAAYHRALSIQPDLHKAQIQAAEIYSRQGRHDRVLASMDRLADATESRLVPARADVLRGIAMNELGLPNAAREHFLTAASKEPTNATPQVMLATTQLRLGDFAGARESLTRAIKIDPSIANDRELMGRLERENSVASQKFNGFEMINSVQR